MVALATSRDHVGPIFTTFFASGNDVIESELFDAEFDAAVLAAIVVSAIHIFSAEFDTREAAVIDKSFKS